MMCPMGARFLYKNSSQRILRLQAAPGGGTIILSFWYRLRGYLKTVPDGAGAVFLFFLKPFAALFYYLKAIAASFVSLAY